MSESLHPDVLSLTVGQTSLWYEDVTNHLNLSRPKRERFEIVPRVELIERAHAWLKADEDRLVASEEATYYTDEEPLVVLALPYSLNHPITHEETINTWAHARGGLIEPWAGRLALLQNWPAKVLEGTAALDAEPPVRFVVAETGYDEDRVAPRDEQLEDLQRIRSRHPQVRSVSLLEGGVMAHRLRPPTMEVDWRDTYVRTIEAEPYRAFVPKAYVDQDGFAIVGKSRLSIGAVARRAIC